MLPPPLRCCCQAIRRREQSLLRRYTLFAADATPLYAIDTMLLMPYAAAACFSLDAAVYAYVIFLRFRFSPPFYMLMLLYGAMLLFHAPLNMML